MVLALKIGLIVIAVNIVLSMIRGFLGPSQGDRLLAVNVIGTKTIVLLGIVGVMLDELFLIDVMLVYALINFIASIYIGKYVAKKGVERRYD